MGDSENYYYLEPDPDQSSGSSSGSKVSEYIAGTLCCFFVLFFLFCFVCLFTQAFIFYFSLRGPRVLAS